MYGEVGREKHPMQCLDECIRRNCVKRLRSEIHTTILSIANSTLKMSILNKINSALKIAKSQRQRSLKSASREEQNKSTDAGFFTMSLSWFYPLINCKIQTSI